MSKKIMKFKMPKWRGIAGRVAAVGLVPLLLLGALNIYIFFEVRKLNDNLSQLVLNTIPAISTGIEMTAEINNIDRIFWQAQAENGSADSVTNLLVDVDAAIDRMNSAFDLYRGYSLPSAAISLRGSAEHAWAKVKPSADKLKAELKKQDLAKASVVHSDEFIPQITALKETISNIGLNNSNFLEAYKKNATAGILQALIFGFTSTILISIFISIFLMRKPMFELVETGDLLGDAGVSLLETSQKIKRSSDSIGHSIAESASLIQGTGSSTEELEAMAKRSSETSASAQKMAADCENKAVQSFDEIKKLVTAISEIEASSTQMRNIVSVIDDIAFQTNLLALNAAVEAARAGEQGRGFAVVADAVRTLSQKSSVSSKEIADLIILTLSKIEVGSAIASATAKSLTEVVGQIKDMSQMNQSISQATEEQSSGIANINKAMNELNSLMQGNSVEAKNAGEASDVLMTNSETLSQITGRIRTVVGR